MVTVGDTAEEVGLETRHRQRLEAQGDVLEQLRATDPLSMMPSWPYRWLVGWLPSLIR
jgi:hypothetical protein